MILKGMKIMKSQENILNNTKKYRRTKKGVLTNIYNHCKNRRSVEFTLKEFQERYINDTDFIRLYNEWIKHNCDIQYKPTIDRINCLKNYSFDNIHWLKWKDNRYKQRMELKRIRARKILMIMDNQIIKEFNSQREAIIDTGLSQANISSCLNGKRKYCGGYEWKYKSNIYDNPELLEEGE